MKQSLVGYVCVCVCLFWGWRCSSSSDEHVQFWVQTTRHPFVGCFTMSRYGWRTGSFWCATFYLKVRRFPVKLLNPNYLGFSLICNQFCTSPLYLDSRFYKMKWSKRNIFVYRNVIVHGDVNPMFDREKIHQGMQLPLFPVRQVGATKIWVFPPSFKDLSILELLETASQMAPLKR